MLDKATTVRQGAKDGTDANVFEAYVFCFQLYGLIRNTCGRLLPLRRHPGRFPLSALGQRSYMGLPSDMPGVDAHRRVSVVRCKPCAIPNDSSNDMPQYFPAGLTQNVPNNFTRGPPPHTASLRAGPL